MLNYQIGKVYAGNLSRCRYILEKLEQYKVNNVNLRVDIGNMAADHIEIFVEGERHIGMKWVPA